MLQSAVFEKDIKHLQKNVIVDVKSSLRSLSPFICKDGILRVGGRLRHANLPYDETHQMILPAKGHLTELIIRHYHKQYLHAGAQAVHAATRNKFWILSGRSTIRRIVKDCTVCFRAKPIPLSQLMGDLPASRSTISLPFTTTGVDFGGPMKIVETHKRGNHKLIRKCYIAVFVCFSTRAVHLDLVSDLTTEAFIACLRRFVARRGNCRCLYSDNATNFVGAHNELRRLVRSTVSSTTNSAVTHYLAVSNISWKFIPPRSPHHGGIWEAAVKSVKFHLTRTVGETLLTFEEYQTLLIQVEACLNSRPLCPISSDPHDLNALTPFHFLLGNCSTSIPDPSLPDTNGNFLSRWHSIQKMRSDIWKRWSREYIHQLQQRSKWQTGEPDLKENDLVLIIDDQLPPLRWPLGGVEKLHPGPDSRVRVATIRTANGSCKRAITRLCKLPLMQEVKPDA